MARLEMEIRTPPADHGEGVLETVAVSHYRCRCEFDVSYCRRFNYPIVNYPRAERPSSDQAHRGSYAPTAPGVGRSAPSSMTCRDTEVVSSPLVEQRQEDGQRHHSADTLSTQFPFAPRITPRESYV